jgi:hypothetical protein
MTSERTPRGWSLRATITLLFAVPFALCVVLFGAFLWSTRISEQGYLSRQEWGEHAVAVLEMRTAAETYVDAVEDMAQTGTPDRPRIASAANALEELRAHLLALAQEFSPEERAEELQLSDLLSELVRRGGSAATWHDPAALAAYRDFFRDEVARAAGRRVDEELAGSIAAAEKGRASSARISGIALGVTVLLMVVGLAICLRFASKLRRGFGALTQAATRIAAGSSTSWSPSRAIASSSRSATRSTRWPII